MRWYRLAAEQGHDLARSEVANMYDNGRGVPLDDAEAVRWFRLIAEQDDVMAEFAQFSLGRKYADGRGVPQDDAEAVRWFRLAAEQGNTPAQFYLGRKYADGRGVPAGRCRSRALVPTGGIGASAGR